MYYIKKEEKSFDVSMRDKDGNYCLGANEDAHLHTEFEVEGFVELKHLKPDQYAAAVAFAEAMIHEEARVEGEVELKNHQESIRRRKEHADEKEAERRICVKVEKTACPHCGGEIIKQI